jgi:mono/diheme cytochrome c family protein
MGSRYLLLLAICGASVAMAQAPAIDFQREIRPLLSDNCFQCHGPDAAARMAGLRLDLKETALTVIAPGKPEASRLYQTDAAAVFA